MPAMENAAEAVESPQDVVRPTQTCDQPADEPPPMPMRQTADQLAADVGDCCDGPLRVGADVRAFYDMNDHPTGYRYVRLLDDADRSEESPMVVGLSTGWILATVAEEYSAAANGTDGTVLIILHGRFVDGSFWPGHGTRAVEEKPINGMYWRVARKHIRHMSMPQPEMALSLLVVRHWEYVQPRQEARSHNVLHEGLVTDALEAPRNSFGDKGEYEVYSAFIRVSEDLSKLGDSLTASLRGQRRAALYFLWPTQRPLESSYHLEGCVAESELIGAMERMQHAGIRTAWPHSAPLYRILAGKLWPPRLGDSAVELHVPPTVEVNRASWKADARAAAEAALIELRRLRAEVHGGEAAPLATYRGVAKLCFSWQGEGVLPFTGTDELARVLDRLLDGGNDSSACLVQERVENVGCELRLVCCRDRAAEAKTTSEGCTSSPSVAMELVRMQLRPPRHREDSTFSLTSPFTMSAAEAAENAFFGSSAALEAAEAEARRLADRWFKWFEKEGKGVPHTVRIDFLAAVQEPSATVDGEAAVQVYTLELTECGASMCGLPVAPRSIAVLNECLADDNGCCIGNGGFPNGFPLPLPPLQRSDDRGSRGASQAARGYTRYSAPSGAAFGGKGKPSRPAQAARPPRYPEVALAQDTSAPKVGDSRFRNEAVGASLIAVVGFIFTRRLHGQKPQLWQLAVLALAARAWHQLRVWLKSRAALAVTASTSARSRDRTAIGGA